MYDDHWFSTLEYFGILVLDLYHVQQKQEKHSNIREVNESSVSLLSNKIVTRSYTGPTN